MDDKQDDCMRITLDILPDIHWQEAEDKKLLKWALDIEFYLGEDGKIYDIINSQASNFYKRTEFPIDLLNGKVKEILKTIPRGFNAKSPEFMEKALEIYGAVKDLT